MNTQTNEATQPEIKRGRGRPINLALTRVLYVDPKTGEAHGQGRLKAGLKMLKITCHRGVSSLEYKHNVTPIVSQEEVTIANPEAGKHRKPRVTKTSGNINVTVIDAPVATESAIEAAPVEAEAAPAEKNAVAA